MNLLQPPTELLNAVVAAAMITRVPVTLLLSVAWVESNYNAKAVNDKSGAIGVMQIMPSNLEPLGITEPTDISQNVLGGAKLLGKWIRRFGLEGGLRSYVWGPQHVVDGDTVPDPVTRYVDKVMRTRGEVKKKFEDWLR